jgi:hypothetical protein
MTREMKALQASVSETKVADFPSRLRPAGGLTVPFRRKATNGHLSVPVRLSLLVLGPGEKMRTLCGRHWDALAGASCREHGSCLRLLSNGHLPILVGQVAQITMSHPDNQPLSLSSIIQLTHLATCRFYCSPYVRLGTH